MDISEQKFIDIDLGTQGIESQGDFETLKPNLMKIFSKVLEKDEKILDLKFKTAKELSVSLIALNQDEKVELIESIKDEEFGQKVTDEIVGNPNITIQDIEIKKTTTTNNDVSEGNWKLISGNTNLDLI